MTTLTPPNRHISRSRLIAGRSRPDNQGQERNDEGQFEEGHQQDVRFDIFVRQEVARGIVEPGRKVADPVDVNATSVADSVRVDDAGFMSVKSKANGPGEISAPAVRLGIRLTNTGAKSIALTSVVVNAYYDSAGTPGIQVTGDPASKPFAGSLKPGEKSTAVFVFNMPVSKRGDATITVSPAPTLPIAVFARSVASPAHSSGPTPHTPSPRRHTFSNPLHKRQAPPTKRPAAPRARTGHVPAPIQKDTK